MLRVIKKKEKLVEGLGGGSVGGVDAIPLPLPVPLPPTPPLSPLSPSLSPSSPLSVIFSRSSKWRAKPRPPYPQRGNPDVEIPWWVLAVSGRRAGEHPTKRCWLCWEKGFSARGVKVVANTRAQCEREKEKRERESVACEGQADDRCVLAIPLP